MRGTKVRIYPTASQEAFLNRIIGCSRFVYNELLARNIAEYQKHKEDPTHPRPNVSGVGLTLTVTTLKKEFEWLSEVPMEALQQSARDLGSAFSRFFKVDVTGHPSFKKRGRRDSFRLHDRYFSIRDGGVRLSRFDTDIKVRWDKRGRPHKPSNVTISRSPSGRWYASFLTEYHDDRSCGRGVVGIDLGISALATLSTGETIENPRHYNKHLRTLQRRHRQFSRTEKGSSNRNKRRLKLARAYEKVSDCRRDTLHKLSTRLINENQVICLETLNVKGMVKMRNLARHIMDAGWGMFTNMLMYKASESGANVVFIDRWHPSTQTCSHCTHRLEGDNKLSLKDRHWTCPVCSTTHDRDINAAVNILNAGAVQLGLRPGMTALISVD